MGRKRIQRDLSEKKYEDTTRLQRRWKGKGEFSKTKQRRRIGGNSETLTWETANLAVYEKGLFLMLGGGS